MYRIETNGAIGDGDHSPSEQNRIPTSSMVKLFADEIPAAARQMDEALHCRFKPSFECRSIEFRTLAIGGKRFVYQNDRTRLTIVSRLSTEMVFDRLELRCLPDEADGSRDPLIFAADDVLLKPNVQSIQLRNTDPSKIGRYREQSLFLQIGKVKFEQTIHHDAWRDFSNLAVFTTALSARIGSWIAYDAATEEQPDGSTDCSAAFALSLVLRMPSRAMKSGSLRITSTVPGFEVSDGKIVARALSPGQDEGSRIVQRSFEVSCDGGVIDIPDALSGCFYYEFDLRGVAKSVMCAYQVFLRLEFQTGEMKHHVESQHLITIGRPVHLATTWVRGLAAK